MYTISAMVRCPIEHSELDMDNLADATLAVEQAVALRLLGSLGMVIVDTVQVVSRHRSDRFAFSVRLVLRCPDKAAAALREHPARMRAHLERQITRSMRELCRRATIERFEVTHMSGDAAWGEAGNVLPAMTPAHVEHVTYPDIIGPGK